jgi:hypothetical protein
MVCCPVRAAKKMVSVYVLDTRIIFESPFSVEWRKENIEKK